MKHSLHIYILSMFLYSHPFYAASSTNNTLDNTSLLAALITASTKVTIGYQGARYCFASSIYKLMRLIPPCDPIESITITKNTMTTYYVSKTKHTLLLKPKLVPRCIFGGIGLAGAYYAATGWAAPELNIIAKKFLDSSSKPTSLPLPSHHTSFVK